jgi:LAS superfamily LD-carboxypeptidase LdcB
MKQLILIVLLFSTTLETTPIGKQEMAKKPTNTYLPPSFMVDSQLTAAKPGLLKPVITKAFVLGKFAFTADTTFVKVDKAYASKTIYLKKETYAAFKKMYAAARKEGIKLTILSGTRNFDYQKGIWERKWNAYALLAPLERAKKILQFSSMPATSRHHWGTDMDLANLNNSYFENGVGKKMYDWLRKHGPTYGFYQVYTDKKTGRTGYNMEKWHWSYLPLAKQYLNFYNQYITYEDINSANGFKGAELAAQLDVIKQYVNGIPEELKK